MFALVFLYPEIGSRFKVLPFKVSYWSLGLILFTYDILYHNVAALGGVSSAYAMIYYL